METISLLEFTDRFDSESACRTWMEAVRWPSGPECPRCESSRVGRLRTRPSQFTCRGCRYRFSVTSGTPLHGTHLPLRTWMLAMYLMATSTKGVSARKLSEWLGVGYRTAWHLGHRIRALMAADPGLGEKLSGIVEADETYVGGPPRRRNRGPRKCRGDISGRGNGKPCVLVAASRGGKVRLDVISTHSAREIGRRLLRWLDPGSVLATDELPAYLSIGKRFKAHIHVRHKKGEYARTDHATGLRAHNNTAESLNSVLKNAIRAVFHGVSRRHLARYAHEIQFRWNQRSRGPMDRLRGLMVPSAPLALGALLP